MTFPWNFFLMKPKVKPKHCPRILDLYPKYFCKCKSSNCRAAIGIHISYAWIFLYFEFGLPFPFRMTNEKVFNYFQFLKIETFNDEISIIVYITINYNLHFSKRTPEISWHDIWIRAPHACLLISTVRPIGSAWLDSAWLINFFCILILILILLIMVSASKSGDKESEWRFWASLWRLKYS